MMKIRIGTRSSDLAISQSKTVANSLLDMGYQSQLITIDTAGDLSDETTFSNIGPIGVFVKEIENALIEGEIDLAVHSLKDLPTISPKELTIAAISERADPADIIISNKTYYDSSLGLIPLKEGSVVGTSSARRKAWLRHFRKDLKIKPIRGNVPTRIKKINQGYDAIVLASAGVKRLINDGFDLNIDKFSVTRLDPEEFIPAPAQGAIALQCLKENQNLSRIIKSVADIDSTEDINLERLLLAQFEGGCELPFGAYCESPKGNDGDIKLFARLELDKGFIEARVSGKNRQTMFKEAMEILKNHE